MNVTTNYSMVLNADGGDGESVKVDFLNLKKAAMILRALNHKLRQQIVKLIDENKRPYRDGDLCTSAVGNSPWHPTPRYFTKSRHR
jgi:hypothetical protein